MRRLLGIVFLSGMALVMIAGFMAVDHVMNDDRKTAVRAQINQQLDAGAEAYEERRDEGCRRRCGFIASISHMVVGLRDGIFKSLPFDPQNVFPPAPEGWRVAAYDLPAVEAIVGAKLVRTPLSSPTDNKLLAYFDDTAGAAETAAVRLFYGPEAVIAMAIAMSRKGLEDPAYRRKLRRGKALPTGITVSGMVLTAYPQISFEAFGDKTTRVPYRHYALTLDGQVAIDLLTRAEVQEVETLLAGFDLAPIVANLPRPPAGYNKSAAVAGTSQHAAATR